MQEHINSRKVTIFRSGSFLTKAQGEDVKDFFSTTKKSIGSYWESTSSKRIGTGLTITEIDILLPEVIEEVPGDREFKKAVNKFYEEIDTAIPYGSGRTFETGLSKSNDLPINRDLKDPSNNNLPLNIMDYIRYRHSLKHPQVGMSKEEADSSVLKEFYIFDKNATTLKNNAIAEERDAAMQLFLSIKKEEAKVNMMLTLLGVEPRDFDNKDDRTSKLRTLAESKPRTFTETYKKEDIEINYWVQTMVNTKILTKRGTRYFVTETNKLLGNTLEEVVDFFNDKTKSDDVIQLKALMQDSLKQPYTQRKRK